MNDRPYSIYVNKRPIKIAFFIGLDSSLELVDSIISYNRELWGGRFNPIILTDGEGLSEQDWVFLREYDPDYIKSTVKVSDEFLKKLSRFTSPLNMEVVDISSGRGSVRISEYPISVVKNLENLKRLEEWGNDKKLVIFKPSAGISPVIKKFLFRNFGLFEHEFEFDHIKIPSDNIKLFAINNLEDLSKALIELSDWRAYYQYQYQGQFCALPNSNRDVNWEQHLEFFGMVVGDTINDVITAWNRTLGIPQWLRKRINQLWVPTEFIEDVRIQTAIASFVNGYARQQGNDNHRGLNIISSSLPQEQLNSLLNSPLIKDNLQVPHITTRLEHPSYPSYDTRDSGLIYLPSGLELHTARTRTEQLQIDDPEVSLGTMGGEKWMADLYVEFENTNDHVIYSSTKWWQIPKRNHLLHSIFNKPARVNRKRTFSVLLERRAGDIAPGEHHLTIRLPDEQEIIRRLIVGDYRQHFTADPRSAITARPYDGLGISVPGQQLRGIVQIFDSIYSAARYLQQRFWRFIFIALSNIDLTRDERQKEELINLIKKQLKNYPVDTFNKDPVINRLSSWFMSAVRKKPLGQKGISFKELLTYAKEEQFDYELKEIQHEAGRSADLQFARAKLISVLKTICNRPIINSPKKNYNRRDIEQELMRSVSDLLHSNALLAGVDARCRRCGQIIWSQIGSINKIITCGGCGYEFLISPEPVWRYRLNTLLASALTQGITPVVLALAELEGDARNSFMYIPSQELYEQGNDKPIAELDLLCIQDGKFIIGEIKENSDLFHSGDFDKIVKVAKKLLPDVVVFSSMDLKPNAQTEIYIAKVRNELGLLGIEVRWVSFPEYYFEPSFLR